MVIHGGDTFRDNCCLVSYILCSTISHSQGGRGGRKGGCVGEKGREKGGAIDIGWKSYRD